MSDQFWVALRAILMVGGGYLAGKGHIDPVKVGPLIEQIMTTIGTIISLGAAGWAIYVRWNTKAVPMATAERVDVPTIDAATGATVSGPAFTEAKT